MSLIETVAGELAYEGDLIIIEMNKVKYKLKWTDGRYQIVRNSFSKKDIKGC